MSLITIPVDFLVLPPHRWSDSQIYAVLSAANRIWAQADIHCLRTGVLTPSLAGLPQGATVDPLNAAASLYLFNSVRGNGFGLRVFLAPSGFAEDKQQGGDSRINTDYCAIRFVRDAPWTGVVLAHEIGHCFSLADLNDPGNLMHGAIHTTGIAGSLFLEQAQIARARGSSLITRFGAGG